MYYYKDIAAHCQVSRRVIHVNGEVKSSVHVNERGWGRYEDHIWEGMASERRVLTRRSAAGARGLCDALRSFAALRDLWLFLAPLMAAAAALWQPPAAKEGQGDCDFPLGPPWILLYPLKRRRSAMGLEAAGRCALARRSGAGARGECDALRSCAVLRVLRQGRAPLTYGTNQEGPHGPS